MDGSADKENQINISAFEQYEFLRKYFLIDELYKISSSDDFYDYTLKI